MNPVSSTTSSVPPSAVIHHAVTTHTQTPPTTSASAGRPQGSTARNSAVRAQVTKQQEYQDFAKAFDASGIYERVCRDLEERFPGFAKAMREFPTFAEHAEGFPNHAKLDKNKLDSLSFPEGKPWIGSILTRMDCRWLDKSEMKPGDVCVSYEPVNLGEGGQNAKVGQFRMMTLQKQADDHNGLPASHNQGCYRSVHGFIWTGNHDESEGPAATEQWGHGVPELVEARAARNLAEAINRVQPGAANGTEHGKAFVFRPLGNFNVALAQTALSMANGHIHYTMKELRSSMRTDGDSCQLTPKAKQRIVDMVEDAFKPVLEWAVNPENMHEDYKAGVICSTFVIKAAQIAAVKQLQAEVVEKALEQQRSHAKENGTEESFTFEMPCIDLRELVDQLTGLNALDASNVSVRTLMHYLLMGTDADGNPQYVFVGKFGMAGKQAAYPERTPPMPTALSTRLAATDSRSEEFVAAALAEAKQQGKRKVVEAEHVFVPASDASEPDRKKSKL